LEILLLQVTDGFSLTVPQHDRDQHKIGSSSKDGWRVLRFFLRRSAPRLGYQGDGKKRDQEQ
jgi:hypothetical protein